MMDRSDILWCLVAGVCYSRVLVTLSVRVHGAGDERSQSWEQCESDISESQELQAWIETHMPSWAACRRATDMASFHLAQPLDLDDKPLRGRERQQIGGRE